MVQSRGAEGPYRCDSIAARGGRADVRDGDRNRPAGSPQLDVVALKVRAEPASAAVSGGRIIIESASSALFCIMERASSASAAGSAEPEGFEPSIGLYNPITV